MDKDQIKAFWKHHLDVWNKSGATELTTSQNGMDFIELKTIGRKSGEPRSNMITTLRNGDRWVIIGSNIGEPNDPVWWGNIKAAGNRFEIRIAGGEVIPVVARELEGEERQREWDRFSALEKSYLDYETMTTRRIPVIELTRA